ncbi:hypothetical protein Taro_041574 [Colocasia esculenta]|uniref:Uncharacterized protein n=1 Tax=Colocasia esculenta TaxID=4460 RepID=A0A843WTZ3_COLES|nr:hypothetical protein [Colocasia esculenta]
MSRYMQGWVRWTRECQSSEGMAIPARCAFGDQSFVLFIGKDMELASIHVRVLERLGINMQKNMLKYLLPIDGHVEQVLHDDGDVQAMFDLHKCQGTSFINLHIHAIVTLIFKNSNK